MRTLPLSVLTFLMFVSALGFSQERSRQERAIIAFDDGVQHLLDGKARRAARDLESAVALDSTFLPALRMLGLAYDLQEDYPAALTSYNKVLRLAPYFSRLLYYHTGEVYLRNQQPREALRYLLDFQRRLQEDTGLYGLNGEQERPAEQLIAEQKLAQRILAAQISVDSTNYTNASGVYNLGHPVNTVRNDYFPFFSNDLSYLLYTRQGEYGDEDLIEGHRRRNANGYAIERFGSFNTSQPEGMCTLQRDGETIYFTMCHDEPEATGCDLYRGLLHGGRIREVSKLPAFVNSSTWDSQAAISCDGRQLFFASTRPGGVGGSDLYVCDRLDDGSWSEPRNLGASVNSPQDEEAPFLSNDGETLYFSSMGHAGLGDQDIYFSRRDPQSGRWTAAVNIGPPINSPARELGFHLSADGRQGWFASDRPGGRGGLDIYGFTLSEALTGKEVTYVSGYVTDSLTGEPLAGQEVPVTGGAVYRTNAAGRFFICAPPDAPLPLTVDHAGYLAYQRSFAIPAWENKTPYRIDLRLRKPPLAEQPAMPPAPPPVRQFDERILFEFEQDVLTGEQRQRLDRWITSVGIDDIDSVSVQGYTDEVGTLWYNRGLSERRAAAVARYLVQLGIPEDRITVEGLGEIRGHRKRNLNRRVDINLRRR